PPEDFAEADYGLHLCEHLADAGVDVHVATLRGRIRTEHPGLTVHYVLRNWSWTELWPLVKLPLRWRPDAVLLMYTHHCYHCHPMITFFAAVAQLVLPGLRFVTVFHDAYAIYERGRIRFKARIYQALVTQLVGSTGVHHCWGTLLRDSDLSIGVR